MSVSLQAAIGLVLLALAASQTNPPQSLSPSPALHQTPPAAPDRPAGYVGDAVCQSCHQGKVETFHRTSHYLTSRLPEKDSVLGKFTPDGNIMKTSNPELFFRMEEKDNGFFQTAVEGAAPFIESRTERFAFVVGSGGKGQTYLFWKGDDLFQLPVSYWTELGWVNSPGYRDGQANFSRPIIPRCLECHGTYFEQLPPPINRYRKTGFIVGITCEKCHGPGRDHAQHSARNQRPVRVLPSLIRRASPATARWIFAPGAMPDMASRCSPRSPTLPANLSTSTCGCRSPIRRRRLTFTAARWKC